MTSPITGTIPVTYSFDEEGGKWLAKLMEGPHYQAIEVKCLPKDAADMKRALRRVMRGEDGRASTAPLGVRVEHVGVLEVSSIRVNGQMVWEAVT